MTTILLIAACLSILFFITYLYFIYAPTPPEPLLNSSIQSGNLIVNNQVRTYLSYSPNAKEKNGKALIIALHGSGMNATRMRQWTGFEFERLADEKGFVVVYPEGYKGNWNDCRIDSPYPAKLENIDDVKFIGDLAGKFITEVNIDPNKVFVFGFSNGGQMALRLAIEQPVLFKSAVAIGANLPTESTCSCAYYGKTSNIMIVAGVRDPVNPFYGGTVSLFGLKKIGQAISAQATAEHFAGRNGINKNPVKSILANPSPNGSPAVSVEVWDESGKPRVELFTIYNGGHVIPQPLYRFPRMMGKTVKTFNSVAKAVEFFKISGEAV